MFAVFEVEGKKKTQVSGLYGSPKSANEFKQRIQQSDPNKVYLVRQNVREEVGVRGTWRDV